MEATMKMPTCYNVMSAEEMTYTEGGATWGEAIMNWTPVGWYMGIMAIRDYRKANPRTWLESGLDALVRDMDSSTQNLVRDVGRTAWVLGTSATGVGFLLNAAIVLL